MKKLIAISLLLIFSVSVVSAQTNQTQETPLEEISFFNETETFDTPKGEIEEDMPSSLMTAIETLVPEQNIEIEIVGEFSDEFYEEIANESLTEEEMGVIKNEIDTVLPDNRSASVIIDSDLEQITLGPEDVENPNVEIDINTTVFEDIVIGNKSIEDLSDIEPYLESGEIEYEVRGIRNMIIFAIMESFLLE